MKRFCRMITMFILCACVFLSACREPAFSWEREIHVLAREEGSGTRTAFEEIFGLLDDTEDGKSGSLTHREAVVARSNGIVLSGVSADPASIGYLSVGSLNSGVRALLIDGIEPSEASIRAGQYPAARAFSLVTKGELSPLASDFLRFIFSQEGQAIVASAGYVRVSDGEPYTGAGMAGKLVLVGSSSVSPVAEKLREAYLNLHPSAEIEIQTSDSTSGIRSVAGGTGDFGMTSRKLNAGEEASGLQAHDIALDGIAVVVHPENPITGLTSGQVRDIYLGKAAHWKDLEGDA